MDSEFTTLLRERSRCEMSDEMIERFIGQTVKMDLKDNEVLIPYGEVDTNLYVQKSGILRSCYFNGEDEKTSGFSYPGGPILCYHSILWERPAVLQVVSCGESTVLKISRDKLYELMKSSHELVRWVLMLYSMQPYATEYKHTAISETPTQRYLWLLDNRPEIIEHVPSKILASYLDITPTHFSRLKKAFFKGEK